MIDYINYLSIMNRICYKYNINIDEYQNKIAGKDWIITSKDEMCLLNFADFFLF